MKPLDVVWLGRCPYDKALTIQKDYHEKRCNREIPDTLLLVEHPPVITVGRFSSGSNVVASDNFLAEQGIEVVRTTRGGDVTYHGPGQLVGYPIFHIKELGLGVKPYIQSLEKVFIRLLKKRYGITAEAGENQIGVWIGNRKITAIGVYVSHFVSMHGFAFNVNTDLRHFSYIVPCGITDKEVTSLQKELAQEQPYLKVADDVVEAFCEVFSMNVNERRDENG
jgi:lipoyl(octanoyl) transferase